MVSNELELAQLDPVKLKAIRNLYPRAIGWGWIDGSRHLVRAELRKRQKSGELVAIWPLARDYGGQTRIPYVRYRSIREVRRRKFRRVALASLVGGVVLIGLLAIAWSARYVIMSAAILIAMTYLIKHLEAHWKRGCPGLHLVGSCKGH